MRNPGVATLLLRTALAPAPLILAAYACGVLAGEGPRTIQLDPFARATAGLARCPPVAPPLVTEEEMRTEAHVRVERGTRCALDGTCEPGGAYRRDPEVNEAVRAAIAGDRHFARTSVWVTTSRRWVTLQGCVRSDAERRRLVAFVARQANVERVFDELRVERR